LFFSAKNEKSIWSFMHLGRVLHSTFFIFIQKIFDELARSAIFR